MTVLQLETGNEVEAAARIREQVVAAIESREVDAVATTLQLFPSGVRTLLADERWSLQTACRVAAALGLNPRVEVDRVA